MEEVKIADYKLSVPGNALLYEIDGTAKLIFAKIVLDQSSIKETALF